MDDLTTGRRWWLIVRGLARAAAVTAVMVALYYTLPLRPRSVAHLLIELAIGVAVLTAMIAWELRAILRSDLPGIRATQALAATTALLLLLFASTYFVMSADDPAAFTETLSRSDALYFTIVVFSTVGFGDITPDAEAARLVVGGQILLDLLVLGLGIQVILGAVRRSRAT
jgi:hypothetical protein